VRVGQTVHVAHLSQALAEIVADERVLESLQRQARYVELGKGRTLTAQQLLENFGFTGDKLFTRLGDLSGGERRRLQLLRLLVNGPNVLLLDEPTNDLDVEMLTVLEDLLDTWPGTLVVVSHDRYFLERTTDDIYALLGDGAIRHLPNGVDEYLQRRKGVVAAATGAATRAASAASVVTASGAGDPGHGSGVPAVLSAADARLLKKEMTKVERRSQKLHAEEDRLHAELAAASTDHEKVLALDAELRVVVAEREQLEDRWLELAEALE
jgi:ATP-binding cassette subfamily F protein uup